MGSQGVAVAVRPAASSTAATTNRYPSPLFVLVVSRVTISVAWQPVWRVPWPRQPLPRPRRLRRTLRNRRCNASRGRRPYRSGTARRTPSRRRARSSSARVRRFGLRLPRSWSDFHCRDGGRVGDQDTALGQGDELVGGVLDGFVGLYGTAPPEHRRTRHQRGAQSVDVTAAEDDLVSQCRAECPSTVGREDLSD
jgi:hypothetical protein